MSPAKTPRRPLAAAVIAAAAVAFARPASSAIVTIGRPQDDDPDAELIALCATCAVNRDLFNQCGQDADDDCPFWNDYIQAADAITDAEPQTLAGLVAKAHAAKMEALLPDGDEEPAGTMAATWAWDLVNDLVRLGGRA